MASLAAVLQPTASGRHWQLVEAALALVADCGPGLLLRPSLVLALEELVRHSDLRAAALEALGGAGMVRSCCIWCN